MFAVPENTVLPAPRPESPFDPLLVLPTPAALVRLAGADPSRWRELLAGRTRPAQLPIAHRDPRVRVWLSGWQPGQRGDRSYPAPQGAFAVLSGVVVERACQRVRILLPGQIRIFGPGYRHTVQGAGAAPAVTVHVQIGAAGWPAESGH